MKYIRLMLLLWVGCAISAMAQNITVEGIVTADDKEPLIGVTVMQTGTTNGSMTDVDGKYKINVPANAKLQFSYVGFKTEFEAINNRTKIDKQLSPEALGLKEVVFLGYSGQKKAELTSAVVSMDGEKLRDVTTNDVGAMLQGKVAGMQVAHGSGQPGEAAKIRIRGTGSIMASADPLYVVDGIPGGSFSHNDVETITVLKDVAATALYGADGANGVIVVTTKRAERNQPTKVHFKATYGRTKAVTGRLKMMTGTELYDTHRQLYSSESQFLEQRPAYLRDTNYDWHKASFDAGNIEDIYVAVSGASAETHYMISTNYYKQDGTLLNTGHDKVNTRFNFGTKLFNVVDMNTRIYYERGNTRQPSSYINLEGAYSSIPWDVPNDANGNLVYIKGNKRPDNGLQWYTQDGRNYLYNEQYNFAKNKSSNLGADLQLNWNLTEWLMATSNNRFSSSEYTFRHFIDPRTYDPAEVKGYYGENLGKSSGWATSNLLRANKTVSIHTITGILGFETGRSVDRLNANNVIEPAPGKPTLAGTGVRLDDLRSYNYEEISWSIFGQAQYNLLDRYFATASFRADASSKFAKNNRVGYFPAISGAWIISNESFMPKTEALNFLKMRMAYGTTGNSRIQPFQHLMTYSLGHKYPGATNPVVAENLANSDLKWEVAQTASIGIDFKLFNRIDVNVDLYKTKNKDLLRPVTKSHTTGFTDRLENAGNMENRGLEIQLTSDNITTKDFTWNTSFNIAFNKNKVVKLAEAKIEDKGALSQIMMNGEDITSWYMPKWVGVDYKNGDPLWEKLVKDEKGEIIRRDVTNVYSEADKQIVGKATPKFVGGLTNSFKYKGIGLDFTANFVYGNDVYNRDREQYDSDGAYLGYNMMSLVGNWRRWEKPGDVATHPKLSMNGNNLSNATSSRYLEDGSFFRMKNITLSYDLPQQWIKSLKMSQCKFFVSGDNIFTITRFSGVDPEVSLERTEYYLPGTYSNSFPISKQILFGVDIKF